MAPVLALALITVAGCAGGATKKPAARDEVRQAPVLRTAWAASHFKSLGGVSGKFRSTVVSRACSQPITEPCTIGGAALIEAGSYTLHTHSVDLVHTAFGNGADVTELGGYRVVGTNDGAEYLKRVGNGRNARCWKRIIRDFGMGWDYPAGFRVMEDAEPVNDPPVGQGAAEVVGHAPTRSVLEFLGIGYIDWVEKRYPNVTELPVHLHIDKAGNAAGFWADGEEVANALVGPAPNSPKSTDPAAFVPADDAADKAWVRRTLSPIRGDFTLYAFGSGHEITQAPRPLCSGRG